jgi:hypothetical protein
VQVVMPARECVTILLELLLELPEIAKYLLSNIQGVKHFDRQIAIIKSSAENEREEPTGAEKSGAGEEGRTPDLMLGKRKKHRRRRKKPL